MDREATMATLLIVDDRLPNRMLLEKLSSLLDGVKLIRTFGDPLQALRWAKDGAPDLVLVDYRMPGLDGAEFTRRFRELPDCSDVPLVVITSAETREVKHQTLQAGATDFLTKPVDAHEFRARCENMLRLRRQQRLLQDRTSWLEIQVQEATREVREREFETLLRLAKAGEFRDEDTGLHVIRMAKFCRIIAQNLGLSKDQCDIIERSAPMHDIGKIGISDSILMKPARLDPDEFELLKAHTTIGYEILKGSPSKYLQAGALIALAHHERHDGKGYPGGLAEDDIPLPARIVAVADVFDALTFVRPYKKTWPFAEALAELHQQKGHHFDPRCVDAFCAELGEVKEILRRFCSADAMWDQTSCLP
jgi:two-component system, response regulator RpfG